MTELELPRHVHKPGRQWLIVHTPEDLAAALKDGWSVDPQVSVLPVPTGIVLTDAPAVPFPDGLDDLNEDPDAPVKRGPGRPKLVR
jgi:hypothetical protein